VVGMIGSNFKSARGGPEQRVGLEGELKSRW
jgi:hypothetical protein